MICPNCGADVNSATKFCPTCGARQEADAQQAQQQQAQPDYQPVPPVAAPEQPSLREPLTTGQFLLMELVAAIPVVGLVMFFVWGFGDGANLNRKSWARSKLIWALISTVLGVLFALLFVGVFAAAGAEIIDEFGMYGF